VVVTLFPDPRVAIETLMVGFGGFEGVVVVVGGLVVVVVGAPEVDVGGLVVVV
jgi:hypothetical protein